jgi:hypothetical protein
MLTPLLVSLPAMSALLVTSLPAMFAPLVTSLPAMFVPPLTPLWAGLLTAGGGLINLCLGIRHR